MESQEITDVIEALESHFADRLSTWETEFVESVRDQHQSGRILSPKQIQKLNEIFEKASNGGRG